MTLVGHNPQFRKHCSKEREWKVACVKKNTTFQFHLNNAAPVLPKNSLLSFLIGLHEYCKDSLEILAIQEALRNQFSARTVVGESKVLENPLIFSCQFYFGNLNNVSL